MHVSCVYILRSTRFARTYVGQSRQPDERLRQHNAGKSRSTRAFVPWQRIYLEVCADHDEAERREQWFKPRHGRKKIVEILRSLDK